MVCPQILVLQFNMKNTVLTKLIVFLFLLGAASSLLYKFDSYLRVWQTLTPPPQIIDVSDQANPEELCEDNKKSYYIFIKEDQALAQQQNRNRTVLIVGGLRGNDFLGTNAILQLYREVKGANIIFFPVANPSGFIQEVAETYPPWVNVEQDFPLLGKTSCFQSSAVRILNHLFKTYAIDLTIYLHDGEPGVVYSWTEKQTKPRFQVPEASLYSWIASNLKNKYETVEKSHVPKGEQIYPFQINKEGSDFVDWAYGASKFPDILAPTCGNLTIEKYPSFTMNGLAVGIAFGLHEEAVADKGRWQRRVIDRAQEMTKWLISLLNPTMEVRVYQNRVFEAKLEGCRNAHISVLRIYSNGLDLVGEVVIDLTIAGQVGWVDLGPIKIPPEVSIPLSGSFEVEYIADPTAVGTGDTFYSRYRQLLSQNSYQMLPTKPNPGDPNGGSKTTSQLQIKNAPVVQLQKESTSALQKSTGTTVEKLESKSEVKKEKQEKDEQKTQAVKEDITDGEKEEKPEEGYSWVDILKMGGYSILGLFAFCCLINCMRVGAIVFRAKNSEHFNEKFEKVEYVQTTEEDIGLDHHEHRGESSSLRKENE